VTELRDAIACVAADSPGMRLTGCTGEERRMIATADAVLAMPEMQAIKKALWGLAFSVQQEYGVDESVADFLRGQELPESVMAWLCEDGDQ
jgi:hypothetical protein